MPHLFITLDTSELQQLEEIAKAEKEIRRARGKGGARIGLATIAAQLVREGLRKAAGGECGNEST